MTGRYIIALIFLIGFMVGIVSTSVEIAGASESPAGKTTHCRLDVVVDPAAKKISGTMDILAEKSRELTIYRNDARFKEFHIPGLKKDIGKDKGEDPFVIRYEGPIQLKYEVAIESSEDNILNDQEIVLKTGWYPVVDGFSTYEVRAVLPKGFVAISEGDHIEMQQQGDNAVLISRLDRPYSDAITLVASKRFVVSHDVLDGIDIYTYFFSDHAGRSTAFIEGAKHYLKMYQSLIGNTPTAGFPS